MKTKHLIIGILSILVVGILAVAVNDKSLAANTNTPTTMKIKTGVLSFYKDTGTNMDTYFVGSANSNEGIDIGEYDASLEEINAASEGDHRFTVSDMRGKSFNVQLASSAMTASGGLTIAATNIGYTGTTRTGTGQPLIAAPTSAADISSNVTFVSRTNNDGPSKFAQEITLTVTIPAAQAPETYTGTLTFTY